MKNYEEKYPELCQFIGLFHQDWDVFFDWAGRESSYKGIVKFYKTNNPLQYVEQTTKELQEFLNLALSEDEIYNVMKSSFYVSYRPAGENLTYYQWLEGILRILEEPMEKTKAEFIPKFTG